MWFSLMFLPVMDHFHHPFIGFASLRSERKKKVYFFHTCPALRKNPNLKIRTRKFHSTSNIAKKVVTPRTTIRIFPWMPNVKKISILGKKRRNSPSISRRRVVHREWWRSYSILAPKDTHRSLAKILPVTTAGKRRKQKRAINLCSKVHTH